MPSNRIRFGLRPRFVLALVAVAIVALSGPAVELLLPLQRELTDQTLDRMAVRAQYVAERVSQLPASELNSRSPAVRGLVAQLHRADMDTTLVTNRGQYLFGYDPQVASLVMNNLLPAYGRVQRRVFSDVDGWGPWARVLTVAHTAVGPVAVAVERSLQEAQTARDALIDGLERAAAVSLIVAIVLGVAIASRMALRTRRLRDAALRVAAQGPNANPPSDDRADEIGDLARAFREMQRRLRAQEQARERFVATASHELRTPLTALQLRLSILHEDLGTAAPDLNDASEQVELAEAQAKRLAKLASDLLDLSRLDAEVELRLSSVDLGPITRAVVAEFDGLGDVDVVLDEQGAGTVVGDPERIAQIVRILVDNARRYSPTAGHVRVIASANCVAVEDDGPGVPAADRQSIFERFSRGDAQDSHSGFGLGLAIGRELARRMEGDLRLSPEAPPTRFELLLVAAEGPSDAPLPVAVDQLD